MANTRQQTHTYMTSDDYGYDSYPQDSHADALESLARLIRAAAEHTARDGITRRVGVEVVTERVQ